MKSWHWKSIPQVLMELKVDPNRGLDPAEARQRLIRFGKNEIRELEGRSPVAIFLSQFTSVLILMLVGACGVSVFLKEFIDAAAIAAIVLLNAVLGFIQEYRAEKTMQALKQLAVPKVRVRRGGHVEEIYSQELVPGDIVFLDAGGHIPADGRLLEAVNLKVSEAALTGESEPVDKDSGCTFESNGEIPIAERRNMVYMGTAVVAGRGLMVVTETGMNTELGKIAAILQTVKREPTPLQKRLERLSRELAVAVLVIVGIIFVIGVLRGGDWRTMFLVAVSMAVAAVPEGLPAVVTIALTLGARRMLNRNALIRRLNAVETLGSVTVICSDKTGTLTQNKMTVTILDVAGDQLNLPIEQEGRIVIRPDSAGKALLLLSAGAVLCNDAVLEIQGDDVRLLGDPTETALLLAGIKLGIHQRSLQQLLPRIGEVPFSSERKRMSTLHRLKVQEIQSNGNEGLLLETLQQLNPKQTDLIFTKGAVDLLLDVSSSVLSDLEFKPLNQEWRQRITAAQNRLSEKGMRVLGVAFRPLKPGEDVKCGEGIENGLCFIGMIGMIDPARPEVRDAVRLCRQAGIRPVMITGDHPLTARYIANDIGIGSTDEEFNYVTGSDLAEKSPEELRPLVARTSIFARVAPEHKLNIVLALQSLNQVVAMTGDGVNDAPALKKADIGVAMGITGTDVAKEAADMVLLDDNFATIVAAVQEGRTIYDNIRKFIRYTFASNTGEIIVMLLAPLLGMPLPLTPLQILWVNLVTDGLPGLALGIEGPERDVMRRPPRPLQESIFAHGLAINILWSGILLGLVSLLTGWVMWRTGSENWRTVIFTVLTMSQLFQSFALRSQRDSLFSLGLMSNRTLLGTFILTLLLQLGLLYIPFAQRVFATRALPAGQLILLLLVSTAVFWAVELEKLIRRFSQRMKRRR
ncbi:MAG: cation-translocating P-type ATPase [candidate division WOR-3 bacterium]|uniref:Cation-translocating P-type ATPase n=1 Tax=candidate division WOR-3 bacterium TaxID=2052148 RepID=A0A7C1NFA0_UNCW3|nr:cation-translocating P-type ATPase [candidate division WOR-3 bacterium]